MNKNPTFQITTNTPSQNTLLKIQISPSPTYIHLLTLKIIGILDSNYTAVFLESIPIILGIKEFLKEKFEIEYYLPKNVLPSYCSENFKISYFVLLNVHLSEFEVFCEKVEFFVEGGNLVNVFENVIVLDYGFCRVKCGNKLREEYSKIDFGINKVSDIDEKINSIENRNTPQIGNINECANTDLKETKNINECANNDLNEIKNVGNGEVNISKNDDIAKIGNNNVQIGNKSNTKINNTPEALNENNIENKKIGKIRNKNNTEIGNINENIKEINKENENIKEINNINENIKEINNESEDEIIKIGNKAEYDDIDKIVHEDQGKIIKIGNNAKYDDIAKVGNENQDKIIKIGNNAKIVNDNIKENKNIEDSSVEKALKLINDKIKESALLTKYTHIRYTTNVENLITEEPKQNPNKKFYSVKLNDKKIAELTLSDTIKIKEKNTIHFKFFENTKKTKIKVKHVEKVVNFNIEHESYIFKDNFNSDFCVEKRYEFVIEDCGIQSLECFWFLSVFYVEVWFDGLEIEIPIKVVK